MIISIDLWGTLIKSSPIFSQKRTELLKSYFPNVTESEIVFQFKETKKYVDRIMDENSVQLTTSQIFFQFYSFLSHLQKISEYDLWKLNEEYQQLALEYPAVLFDENIAECLEKLSWNNTLVLSSNTSFITGETLRIVLSKNLDILKKFFTLNFSNELGYCKPDKRMYSNSLVHIGDNFKTDFEGANNAGSKGFLVNGETGITFKDVTETILKIFK